MSEFLLSVNPDTLVYIGFLILYLLIYLIVMTIIERSAAAFKKDKQPFTPLMTAIFCLLGTALTLPPVFVIHMLSPVYIPTYTLTNGNKTIVFQGMQHIGSRDYYVHVDQDIRNARHNGYTILREGIGANDSGDISQESCNVPKSKNLLNGIEQPNCLGGIMPKDIYADISLEYLMDYYAKEAKDKGLNQEDALLHQKKSFNKTISFLMEVTSGRSNNFNYYIMKPYFVNKSLAMLLRHGEVIINSMGEFDSIIMDERNRVLTEKILTAKNNKLYVFYGAGHFKGVLKLLKNMDTNWKVTNIDYLKSM